jgi:hypothetical protein
MPGITSADEAHHLEAVPAPLMMRLQLLNTWYSFNLVWSIVFEVWALGTKFCWPYSLDGKFWARKRQARKSILLYIYQYQ